MNERTKGRRKEGRKEGSNDDDDDVPQVFICALSVLIEHNQEFLLLPPRSLWKVSQELSKEVSGSLRKSLSKSV